MSMIDLIHQSIDELRARMQSIEDHAVSEGRDTLNGHEQQTWDELRAEMAAKTARLNDLVGRHELDAQAGLMVARMSGGAGNGTGSPAQLAGRGDFPYRTPGEYVLAYMRMKHGDSGEAARFTRALADVTTAQTPGLVPPQVTGDVLGTWLGNRPSIDVMTMPDLPPVGMEIQRPHIAQHTDVGPHVEKAAVASQAFHLDLLKIPVGSWAGGVDVSWELANRSNPGALDLIFNDLAAVYGRKSDEGAFGAMWANVTQSVSWDGTAATLASAITAAAVMCATNGEENLFPDTVWLGLDAYAALAGLSDTTGRPMFANLTPANAPGAAGAPGELSSVYGLRPAIDPYIPPSSFLVGPSDQAEFYETPGAPVQLSVVDVGVAGYNIGVIGMWAAVAVDPASFCKVTFPPPAGTTTSSGGRGSKS